MENGDPGTIAIRADRAEGFVMSYRDRYLSLDPTYTDGHGLPLLRLTFDWHDNEYKMAAFGAARVQEIVRVMKPEQQATLLMRPGDHYDVRIYQSTHATGGAILGTNPSNSFINRYSQSWDVSNLFVMGASAFPQNIGYIDRPACSTRLFFSRENSPTLISNRPGDWFRHEMENYHPGSRVCRSCGLLATIGMASILDRAAGEKELDAPAPSAILIARGEYLRGLVIVPHVTPFWTAGVLRRPPFCDADRRCLLHEYNSRPGVRHWPPFAGGLRPCAALWRI